jgi:16S rRNA (cytosine967-C5)-methyltransferase
MDRIPAHAVLNESVELCRAAGHPHAAGMVNAILRKLAAAQKPGTRIFESPAAFAERLAHPLWLVERWVADYGREAALAICDYDQHEPHSGTLFPASTEPTELTPHIDDGSRLVAELTAVALPSTARTPHIWDCCAAPGGKTLILALRHPTAEILATDVSAKRLTLTAARLRQHPYAANVRTQVADATATQATAAATHFDLILCDVPCSGTGTLARNPEIRHHLRPEDLARQSARQRDLLTAASQHLAPGGRIVYSTCSLEPEENEQVIDAVATAANLRRVPIAPLLANLAAANILPDAIAATIFASAISADSLRTLPGLHPCDGFFAAILERN